MAQQIANPTSTSMAPPSSRFATRTAELRNRVVYRGPGRYELPAGSRPEGEERAAIRERLRGLKRLLRPATAVEIADAITAFLAGFTSMRSYSDEQAALTATEFCKKLRPYPAWAIQQACDGWDPQASGSDPRFPPTPAQLQIAIRAVVRPWQVEAGDLETILLAQAPQEHRLTPDQQAELDARLASIIDRQKGKHRPASDIEIAAPDPLELLKARGLGGVKLSDTTLAKALGRAPKQAHPT
ncbi:hypothetical protein LRS73_17525 [Methylobacterium currus]|uniref:hypothetical protein n=1 Tax=Methylobacterium currus TaxID=2051553 RepID=UPI001E3D0FFC|nr:hypothetical protein [Methylobacterium currus]UHC14361.1 hypothetical protein LRS73_17525 [Methylobacterium currus]